MSLKALPIIIAATASVAIVTPASATAYSFAVKAHELKTAKGAQAVYERIEQKAKQTCGSSQKRSLDITRFSRQCEAHLTAEIVESIDNARLTSIHAAATSNGRYASR